MGESDETLAALLRLRHELAALVESARHDALDPGGDVVQGYGCVRYAEGLQRAERAVAYAELRRRFELDRDG